MTSQGSGASRDVLIGIAMLRMQLGALTALVAAIGAHVGVPAWVTLPIAAIGLFGALNGNIAYRRAKREGAA